MASEEGAGSNHSAEDVYFLPHKPISKGNPKSESMATSRLERRPSLCIGTFVLTQFDSHDLPLLTIVVSPIEVDKLYHYFLKIDSNGNGVIDKDELLSLPSVQGNPLARRLLELFDTDQSGDINFSEFVAGLATFSSKSSVMTKLKCKSPSADRLSETSL